MQKPVVAETREVYSVRIRPSVVEEYSKLAGKMFMTTNQLMSNALVIALDDLHMLEVLGVVRAVGGIRQAKVLIEEWRQRREEIVLRGNF
jgi:hypothetical protein